MAEEIKYLSLNDLLLDGRHLQGKIRDLPNGARQGMRAEQPNFPNVIKEITDNQPLYGEQAGISSRNFQDLQAGLQYIAELDAMLPSARKFLEVLEETRAYEMDQIQRLVSSIAYSVEGRAKAYKDDELLARYEQTRAYRSAAGLKAARTRLRNLAPESPEAPESPDSPEQE
jgi:hypothetical protein